MTHPYHEHRNSGRAKAKKLYRAEGGTVSLDSPYASKYDDTATDEQKRRDWDAMKPNVRQLKSWEEDMESRQREYPVETEGPSLGYTGSKDKV